MARATAIALRESRVLLVQERRARKYSLPGGRVSKRDENSVLKRRWWIRIIDYFFGGGATRQSAEVAVVRELKEETDLTASEVEWLFRSGRHWVFAVPNPLGEVRIQRRELRDYSWWDGKDHVRITDRTRKILKKYGFVH